MSIQNPVISNEDLDKIKYIEHADYKSISISTLYAIDKGVNGLENALENIITEIEKAVETGVNIVILSDRGVAANWHQFQCYWPVLTHIIRLSDLKRDPNLEL